MTSIDTDTPGGMFVIMKYLVLFETVSTSFRAFASKVNLPMIPTIVM
ncbi:hypothetical protein SP39_24 [Salmonella phage 39]|nr:hypothetical protein SP39_24 [Salmonella phage 39]